MSKSVALGIIFLVEFGLGLWQFKPHGPISTPYSSPKPKDTTVLM